MFTIATNHQSLIDRIAPNVNKSGKIMDQFSTPDRTTIKRNIYIFFVFFETICYNSVQIMKRDQTSCFRKNHITLHSVNNCTDVCIKWISVLKRFSNCQDYSFIFDRGIYFHLVACYGRKLSVFVLEILLPTSVI